MQQLYRQFRDLDLTYEDLIDKRFTRLKWLRYMIESEKLDGALRWNHPAEEKIYPSTEQTL